MKVSLAAQVLGNSVALDLESRNWPGTKETETFIKNVNDFFDMLNGAGYSDDTRKANPNLALYTDKNDERFTKLLAFLDYLKGWKAQVDAKTGNKPSEKAKMTLSHQTLEGIEITIRSFIALTKYLLGKGLKFLRARDLIQDEME